MIPMKNDRRNFIKNAASVAAAVSVGGVGSAIANPLIMKEQTRTGTGFSNLAKDAGMQASEAYFSGMNERKVALLKQMDVMVEQRFLKPTNRELYKNNCKQTLQG